jgi:hypothetical protein
MLLHPIGSLYHRITVNGLVPVISDPPLSDQSQIASGIIFLELFHLQSRPVSALSNQTRNQGCPAGLMGGTTAATCIGMEKLVEENEVPPCWVAGIASIPAMAGTVTVFVSFKQACHAAGDLA